MHPSNRNRVPPIQGLSNPQYAEGADRGPIYGDPSVMPDNVPWNQPQGMDDIPAMLTEGEYVVNKEATNMFGPQIEAMNQAGLEARDSGITPPPQQQPQQQMSAPIQKVVQQDRYGNRTEVTYDTAVPPVPEQVPSMFNAGGVAEATHTSNARQYVDWMNKGDYSQAPWFKPYPGPDPAPQYKPNGPVIKPSGNAGPPYYNAGGSVPQYYGLGDWVSSLFGGEDPNAGYADYTQEQFVDEANNPGRNVAPSVGQYSPVPLEQPSVPGMHQMPDGSMMPDSAHPGASTDAKIANVGNSLGFNTNTGAALGPKAVNQPVIDTKTDEPINVFDEIFEDTLKFEGGYSDNKNDKGGKTNYGITWETFKRHYPEGTEDQLKNISKAAAKNIYRKDYYEQPGIDKLPVELQHQVFDIATNSGGPTAIRMLQELAGVKQDGILGPETIAAVEAAGITNDQLADRRSQFYSSILDRDPTQEQFIAGWMKRADAFRDGDLGDAARKHYGIDVKEVDTPAWDLDGDGTISSNEEANLEAAGYDTFAPQDAGFGAATAGSTSGQFDTPDPRNLGGSEGYGPFNDIPPPVSKDVFGNVRISQEDQDLLDLLAEAEATGDTDLAEALREDIRPELLDNPNTINTNPNSPINVGLRTADTLKAGIAEVDNVLNDTDTTPEEWQQAADRKIALEDQLRQADIVTAQDTVDTVTRLEKEAKTEISKWEKVAASAVGPDKVIAEQNLKRAKDGLETITTSRDIVIEANTVVDVLKNDSISNEEFADLETKTHNMFGDETGAGAATDKDVLRAEHEAMTAIAKANKNTPGVTKEEEKPGKVKSFIIDSLKTAFSKIIGSDGSNADMKKVLGESVAQALILYAGSRALGYDHGASLGYAVNKGLEAGAARNQARTLAMEERRTWALTKTGLSYPAKNVQKYIKSGDLRDLGKQSKAGVDINRVKSTNKEVLVSNNLIPVVEYEGVEMVYLGADKNGGPLYVSLAQLRHENKIANIYDRAGVLEETTTLAKEALDSIPAEERELLDIGPSTVANQMERAIREFSGTNTVDPADIQAIVPIAIRQYYAAVRNNKAKGIPEPKDAGAFIKANLVFAGTNVDPSLFEGASTERVNKVSNRIGVIAQAASSNVYPPEAVRADFLNRTQVAFNDFKATKPEIFKTLVVEGSKKASTDSYQLTPYLWFLENVTSSSPTGETSQASTAKNEIKQFYKDWTNAYSSANNKQVILK